MINSVSTLVKGFEKAQEYQSDGYSITVDFGKIEYDRFCKLKMPQLIGIHNQSQTITQLQKLSTHCQKKELFEKLGSGWVYKTIKVLHGSIHEGKPLSASTFNALPKMLLTRKCFVSVQNEDVYCFVWCVLAAL